MPTYEYACPDCGIVEHFQSMKDKPLTRCPRCGVQKVTRLVSGGSGVIFRGSGFWETDYNRSADYAKKSAEAAGTATKDAASATDTPKPKAQAQTKPAATTTGDAAAKA